MNYYFNKLDVRITEATARNIIDSALTRYAWTRSSDQLCDRSNSVPFIRVVSESLYSFSLNPITFEIWKNKQGVVITPIIFCTEWWYFMESGIEWCYSGHSRLIFRVIGVIAGSPAKKRKFCKNHEKWIKNRFYNQLSQIKKKCSRKKMGVP